MIHSARPIVTPVANIVFCCFIFLDLKSWDGRTDNMCENNDPYRPWLWDGRMDQSNLTPFSFLPLLFILVIIPTSTLMLNIARLRHLVSTIGIVRTKPLSFRWISFTFDAIQNQTFRSIAFSFPGHTADRSTLNSLKWCTIN